jgi:hypothetical protein
MGNGGTEKTYTQPATAWLRETRARKAKISLFGGETLSKY